MRVLLLEDCKLLAALLVEELMRRGHEVIYAETKDQVPKMEFDVMLVDIMGTDGEALLNELDKGETKVFIITNYSSINVDKTKFDRVIKKMDVVPKDIAQLVEEA